MKKLNMYAGANFWFVRYDSARNLNFRLSSDNFTRKRMAKDFIKANKNNPNFKFYELCKWTETETIVQLIGENF